MSDQPSSVVSTGGSFVPPARTKSAAGGGATYAAPGRVDRSTPFELQKRAFKAPGGTSPVPKPGGSRAESVSPGADAAAAAAAEPPAPPTMERSVTPDEGSPTEAAPPRPVADAFEEADGIARVYAPRNFHHFRDLSGHVNNGKDLISTVLSDFIVTLWPDGVMEEAPTASSGGASSWSREDMFSDTARNKKFERKMQQQVMGILARLTPQNYDVMRKMLCELPIRQSTDEEIAMVVNTMYTKAVRPEDELYVELYAQLLTDLVKYTEEVGKRIRHAIIDQCQAQFQEPFELKDKDIFEEDGVTPIDATLLDRKMTVLKAKLRSNIKFLGYLFVFGMVNEKVINCVLYNLLYGHDHSTTGARSKRKPKEHELEMFVDLLRKVIQHLAQKTHQTYLPGYITTVRALVNSSSLSQRIRFMLADLVELSENGWVDTRRARKKTGPMTLDDLDRQQEANRLMNEQEVEKQIRANRTGAGRSMHAHGAMTVLKKEAAPLPRKDEVYGVMDSYKASKLPADIAAFFKPLPPRVRGEYIEHLVLRVVKVVKKEDERQLIGDFLSVLLGGNLINADDVANAMNGIIKTIVDEQLYDDNPKIFQCWANLVANTANSAPSLMAPDLHTALIRSLLSSSPKPSRTMIVETVRAITDVQAKFGQAPQQQLVRRFRLLPAVLSDDRSVTSPDDEGMEEDDPDVISEDDDLLSAFIKLTDGAALDPELKLFDFLCTSPTPQRIADFRSRHPDRADSTFSLKIFCAVFAYTRCDESFQELDRCKELLVQTLKGRHDLDSMVLMEVYLTHRELGKSPRNGFLRFADFIRNRLSPGIGREGLLEFKAWAEKHFPREKNDWLIK
jgi:translation initiation factor 4G